MAIGIGITFYYYIGSLCLAVGRFQAHDDEDFNIQIESP